MALVIVAGVLGVITICGGLFLRRLLGELAELRRQITRFDRQMRAQRARETFLRQLIAYGDSEDGDRPPEEAAVVNGHDHAAVPPPLEEHAPVRRKKHLGLYIGGGGTLAALTTAARQAARAHSGQVIGALTGAAVTAATVTVVTVQPWEHSVAHRPHPSSATTQRVPASHLPTAAHRPATIGRPPSASPAPSASAATPGPSVSQTAGASPSPALVQWSRSTTHDALVHVPNLVPGANASSGTDPARSPRTVAPAPVPSLAQPTVPGLPSANASQAPSSVISCTGAGTPVVAAADVCVPGG